MSEKTREVICDCKPKLNWSLEFALTNIMSLMKGSIDDNTVRKLKCYFYLEKVNV